MQAYNLAVILPVGALRARPGLTNLVSARTGSKLGVLQAAAMATVRLPAVAHQALVVAPRVHHLALVVRPLLAAVLPQALVAHRLARLRALVVTAAAAITRTGTPTAIIHLAAWSAIALQVLQSSMNTRQSGGATIITLRQILAHGRFGKK